MEDNGARFAGTPAFMTFTSDANFLAARLPKDRLEVVLEGNNCNKSLARCTTSVLHTSDTFLHSRDFQRWLQDLFVR